MFQTVLTLAFLVAVFLLFVFRARYCPEGNPGFFDLKNTQAMRGFWCIVILLVHVPLAYQNKAQDMAGSFACVGVTFFFMTSAYGLCMQEQKGKMSLSGFWQRRLPKLLLPAWLINILFGVAFLLWQKEDAAVFKWFVSLGWLLWLLYCYLSFWLSRVICAKKPHLRNAVCAALIIPFSVLLYMLKANGSVTATVWPTDIYGFLWGLLLAQKKDRFLQSAQKNWARDLVLSGILALLLGLAYLKLKPIAFFGDYLVKILMNAAILLFILVINARVCFGNPAILYLGSLSLEFFLSHTKVFRLIEYTGIRLGSFAFILVSVLLTFAFSAALHALCGTVLKKLPKR